MKALLLHFTVKYIKMGLHFVRRYFSIRRKSKLLLVLMILSWIFMVSVFVFQERGRSKLELFRYREERYLAYQNRGPRSGPGENGVAVTVAPEEKQLAEKLWKNASFNVLVSDKIALDRSIPDTRRRE